MQTQLKNKKTKLDRARETRLESILAKLDELMLLAGEARNEFTREQESSRQGRKHGHKEINRNLNELQSAMEKCWVEIQRLWIDQKLRSERRILEYDHYYCDSCRSNVYDELTGDPARSIPAKTRVNSLPNTWRCPVCAATKEYLRPSTLPDDMPLDNAES